MKERLARTLRKVADKLEPEKPKQIVQLKKNESISFVVYQHKG